MTLKRLHANHLILTLTYILLFLLNTFLCQLSQTFSALIYIMHFLNITTCIINQLNLLQNQALRH